MLIAHAFFAVFINCLKISRVLLFRVTIASIRLKFLKPIFIMFSNFKLPFDLITGLFLAVLIEILFHEFSVLLFESFFRNCFLLVLYLWPIAYWFRWLLYFLFLTIRLFMAQILFGLFVRHWLIRIVMVVVWRILRDFFTSNSPPYAFVLIIIFFKFVLRSDGWLLNFESLIIIFIG